MFATLASFTNRNDPWTNDEILENANHLLSKYEAQSTSPKVLVDYILKQRIQRLFQRHAAVTTAGRKVMGGALKTNRFGGSEQQEKLWTSKEAYNLTAFEWTLRNLDVSTC